MKQLLMLSFIAMLTFLSGCRQNHKTVYMILPDDVLYKYEIYRDSIVRTLQTNAFEPHTNEGTVFKIRSQEKAGDTCYLCVEASSEYGKDPGFTGMTLVSSNEAVLLVSAREQFMKLAECKEHRNHTSDHMYFTLFTKKALDSFSHFRRLTSLDTTEACDLMKRCKALSKVLVKQIEEVAPYDMYFSATGEELVNRVMLEMHIDPLHLTNDDMRAVLKKCNP